MMKKAAKGQCREWDPIAATALRQPSFFVLQRPQERVVPFGKLHGVALVAIIAEELTFADIGCAAAGLRLRGVLHVLPIDDALTQLAVPGAGIAEDLDLCGREYRCALDKLLVVSGSGGHLHHLHNLLGEVIQIIVAGRHGVALLYMQHGEPAGMGADQIAGVYTRPGSPAHVQLKLYKGGIRKLQQQIIQRMLGIVCRTAELGGVVVYNARQSELPKMLAHLGHLLCTALAVVHGDQMIQGTDVGKLRAEFLGKSAVFIVPQAVERNDTNAKIIDKLVEIRLAQSTGVGTHGFDSVKADLCQSLNGIQDALLGRLQNGINLETKGKTMNITISYINTSDTALNGYVIAAYFNGNKLIKVAYSAEITRDASVKSDTIKCSLTVPDFGSAEQYTSAKLMFWNGLDKMIPITEVYPIK